MLGILTKFAVENYSNNNLNFYDMKKSVFYHAGCPVCISAEHDIISLIGQDSVEIVHLGDNKERIEEAEEIGVQSVPALVTPNDTVLHLNFGASIAELKG